jgi:alkanesulfonate monooxygenase SsuD/methylene tetrahydromethanopterin reductase-like flavin-dependent oxidoreductase (luciferase family)
MTVGHPHPPERVRAGVEAWKQGLMEAGIGPKERHCQFHVRTHVNESSVRAEEIARAAISRYDEISRIGRKSLTVAPAHYDWHAMLAAGRNLYGHPEECIKIFHNARQNYYFDTLTTTFNFGGIAHEQIKKSMCLFAKEVMPVIKSE